MQNEAQEIKITTRDSSTSIPNRELVLYALFILGGATKRVHTEDIALKCFEFFPQSFSWVKYPKYPDKDIVRVALTDARKSQYGGLVEGRAGQKRGLSTKTKRKPITDGWILTPKGIAWIQKNQNKFEKYCSSGQAKEHRQKILRKLKRIKEHRLYQRYMNFQSNFNPKIGDIADLLLCRVDAEEEIWNQRFETIRRQAQATEQLDILKFIDICGDAYMKQR